MEHKQVKTDLVLWIQTKTKLGKEQWHYLKLDLAEEELNPKMVCLHQPNMEL